MVEPKQEHLECQGLIEIYDVEAMSEIHLDIVNTCKYSHLPIAIGTLVWKKDGKSSICVHIFLWKNVEDRDFPVPKKSAKFVDVQTAHCVKVTLQVRNDPTALHLRSAESPRFLALKINHARKRFDSMGSKTHFLDMRYMRLRNRNDQNVFTPGSR